MSNIKVFWEAFVASLPVGSSPPVAYEAWSFGDSPEMAEELGRLVRMGVKTATCSLLWSYEAEGEALPAVGEFSVITDGAARPCCIIETTEVEVKAFNQVDEQFAYDEGEGDRSLAYWQEAHWRFFSRACAAIGRKPDETMSLVCERFRVVYPNCQSPETIT